MTAPVNSSSADVYTDLAGLTALKKDARTNDPGALRQVAKQYESLFASMMIKSMRQAVGKDPMFGSDEEQTYQEMYDNQLSLEMTKGHGLGLADMLVRQLQKLGGGSPADATQDTKSAKGGSAAAGASAIAPLPGAKATVRKFQGPDPRIGDSSGSAVAPAASPEARETFISDLWPSAQAASKQLGVDPRNLIAQAALETNWGTRVPHDAQGRSTNNLFGLKAGGQWGGASVSAGTQEYENGVPVSTMGKFRAYDSREQSFHDYVTLLRSSPRYAAALNTGNNAHAFASALQRGGYATDPDYAGKVAATAAAVGTRSASLAQSFKSASIEPITQPTGVL
jgi:peptidoglycan hydrolase FlgJ